MAPRLSTEDLRGPDGGWERDLYITMPNNRRRFWYGHHGGDNACIDLYRRVRNARRDAWAAGARARAAPMPGGRRMVSAVMRLVRSRRGSVVNGTRVQRRRLESENREPESEQERRCSPERGGWTHRHLQPTQKNWARRR